MVCERPPAAFGGSPPHRGGDASEASEGVAHTASVTSANHPAFFFIYLAV